MFEYLLELLRDFKWSKYTSFPDAKNNWRFVSLSQNVGYVIRHFQKGRPLVPSRFMAKDDRIYRECKNLFPDFTFNAIQINKNLLCPPHRDKNNYGTSLIFSLGDFEGGNLNVEGQSIDIYEQPFEFDGSKQTHYTEDFDGERYSVVLFNLKN